MVGMPKIKDAKALYDKWSETADVEAQWPRLVEERRTWFLGNGWKPVTREELHAFRYNPRKKIEVRCFCYSCGCYGGKLERLQQTEAPYKDGGFRIRHTGHGARIITVWPGGHVSYAPGVHSRSILVKG